MTRKPVAQPVIFSGQRSALIILVAIMIVGALVYESIIPLRQIIAERYLKRGDTALAALQFTQAETEYARALRYDKALTEAADRKTAAKTAQYDPADVRPVFIELDAQEYVRRLDDASQAFTSAPVAYAAGVRLFESGDYALAQYPLERAAELDPNYPDTWHYLYQTYTKLAEIHADFREKAAAAKQKRDELTARWLEAGE